MCFIFIVLTLYCIRWLPGLLFKFARLMRSKPLSLSLCVCLTLDMLLWTSLKLSLIEKLQAQVDHTVLWRFDRCTYELCHPFPASPSQLFRSNTICNRMLSAFARQYGYIYLRKTLESLVQQMMNVPHGCSFELDSSKLPASEDPNENAQTLMVIAQAFIDDIADSVTDIPS